MTTDYVAEHDGPTLAELAGVSNMTQHVTSEIVTITTQTYKWVGTGFPEGSGPFDLAAKYLPNDNSTGKNSGLSQGALADAAGNVTFFAPLSMFVGGKRPGVLRVWMTEAGAGATGEPIMLTDGTPAVTEEVIA